MTLRSTITCLSNESLKERDKYKEALLTLSGFEPRIRSQSKAEPVSVVFCRQYIFSGCPWRPSCCFSQRKWNDSMDDNIFHKTSRLRYRHFFALSPSYWSCERLATVVWVIMGHIARNWLQWGKYDLRAIAYIYVYGNTDNTVIGKNNQPGNIGIYTSHCRIIFKRHSQ